MLNVESKILEIKSVINGEEFTTDDVVIVKNKFSNEPIANVYLADKEIVDKAVTVAYDTFLSTSLGKYQRYEILKKASDLVKERKEELAVDLVNEVGKTLKEARTEVDRAVQTLLLSAEEAKNLVGEQIPIDSTPNNEKKIALYTREPLGVICAITPFNVPLNLACHKIGPAIAGGNTVVWKPATETPITAYKLAKILEDAGLPSGYVNLVYGSGSKMGAILSKDERIAKFSFTGSYAVGKWLKENTGLKSVSLELGNNSPNIIHKDADVNLAASSCVKWGYANAGQTCISVQRIFVHEEIYEEFKIKAIEITKNLKVGNPLDESTDMGPMINGSELDRIEEWVNEAVSAGANVLIGGKREGNIYYPTILEDVNNEMKVVCQETFAPILTLIKFNDIDEVIAEANNSDYGLQSAVFTKDIDVAFYVANKLKTGGVIVNDGSTYRADLMPYGGIKNSGSGKEGPKYAIKEMTYMKPIVINLNY